MIIVLAMLIGALTSAAWVATRPLCYVISFLAWALFVIVRYVQ